jgi:phage protein U
MNTFVFNAAKTNLRQRVGYFGAQNGIYLELDGTSLSFVQRSSVSGSLDETKVAQADWNLDPLDGTGPSLLTLDISKAQIFWMDIEWLGVGSVRCGFVIDGKMIHCHSFHHANLITSTYITTASLPLRYEIKNTGITDSSSTLKQICSTVISEGGYELRGTQQSIGTEITAGKTLTTKGTFYPVVALRLKSSPDRLDAIAVLTAISLLGTGNGVNYKWRVVQNCTVSGGTWTSAGTNSSVEYSLDSTAVDQTNSRTLASGFLNSSNQGSPTLNILKEALFTFQLERNGLTSTPSVIALIVTADTDTSKVYGSLDWEEISR